KNAYIWPNSAVKWDAPPYGGFESLFFYQGLAASVKLSERRAPYLNVRHTQPCRSGTSFRARHHFAQRIRQSLTE
ncbi:MAG: hypothetical protein QX198_16960, partial [Methylococcaceae bacterium]